MAVSYALQYITRSPVNSNCAQRRWTDSEVVVRWVRIKLVLFWLALVAVWLVALYQAHIGLLEFFSPVVAHTEAWLWADAAFALIVLVPVYVRVRD